MVGSVRPACSRSDSHCPWKLCGPLELWDSCGLRGLWDMGDLSDVSGLRRQSDMRRWRELWHLQGLCGYSSLWVLCDLWDTSGMWDL